MPEHAPLTEDEAEAALLALPPQLHWTERTSNVSVSQEIEYNCFYTILAQGDGGGLFMSRFAKGGASDWNPVLAPTLEKAKIACERHHATGRWKLEMTLPSALFELTKVKMAADAKAKAEKEGQAIAEAQAYEERLLPFREVPLQWTDVSIGQFGTCILGGEPFPGNYLVTWVTSCDGVVFNASRRSDNLRFEQSPKQYPNLEAAKAACERRHATGEWD